MTEVDASGNGLTGRSGHAASRQVEVFGSHERQNRSTARWYATSRRPARVVLDARFRAAAADWAHRFEQNRWRL